MKQPLLGTGLSGMVGSRFQELYGEEYDFENLDLSEGVDITNAKQVDEVVGKSKAATLIHLAAFTNVSAAHEQDGDESDVCYRVNVVGTETIARSVKKFGKYLIHISTDFVFDGTKEEPYIEEDVPHPIEWYGKTKYWAEKKVQEICDRYVILRIAYPYQAKPVRPDFLTNMILKLKTNSLPPAFTNHWVTPTFVDDLLKVFNYCILNKPAGLYHSTGSSWHTDHEMAVLAKELFGLEGEVKKGNLDEYLKIINRPYQRSLKVSNEKLRKEFGIGLSTFREGIEKITGEI
jgi:dTDP-4-dehydrorhamnose reductase